MISFGRSLAIVTMLMGGLLAEAGAAVIYDNTTTPVGPLSFTALEIGDEVEAAGTARALTELTIGVSQQGFAGTADLQARLYRNDGQDGAPGTLLWESPLLNDVALSGGIDLIAFAVPGIVVPDVFTWTLQVSDTEPVGVGLPHFDPPTVGASPDYAWVGSPGSFGKLVLPDETVNFMARISAVPGPGSAVLVMMGLGIVWLSRRAWASRPRH